MEHPPHDIAAEQAVLGAMLLNRQCREHAAGVLHAADFWLPMHAALFGVLLDLTNEGHAADRVVLLDRMSKTPYPITATDIGALQLACPVSLNVDQYAAIVERHSIARRLVLLTDELRVAAYASEVDDALTMLDRARDAVAAPLDAVMIPPTADELIGMEATVQWVVPRLLARQESVLFVAEPGSGKTTLMNQIAVRLASGRHPWTHHPIQPVKCLVFDFQDSLGARARGVRHLLDIAGTFRRAPENLRYEVRPAGIDLTAPRWRRWMEAKVNLVRPDVVFAGPLYNMVQGDQGRAKHGEETAQIAGAFLSTMMARYDCALIVEAHAPHGDDLRVRGSKYWEDWAAFGFGLRYELDNGRRRFIVTRFRGDRETGREWPTFFVQGHSEGWPWEVPPGALPAEPPQEELR